MTSYSSIEEYVDDNCDGKEEVACFRSFDTKLARKDLQSRSPSQEASSKLANKGEEKLFLQKCLEDWKILL